MKDKALKLEDIEGPDTLGGTSYILFRDIDLAEGGKGLAEVEFRKPSNTFVCLSEEREDWGVPGRVRARKRYLSRTLRYINPAEVAEWPVGLRGPVHLCAYVSEDYGDGEGAGAHATLLSDTRRSRNVSLAAI